ncbi:MAG: hypothetical protein QGI21_01375 [Candidatus Poseidoniaceae archaeon]|jgi:hypothetical protein|nr:hypothetical protein [Candidatus Poseidoniaceae archaeon]
MGPELLPLLNSLGVSLDCGSIPLTSPGVISWLGRIKEVTPEQMKNGLSPGMEVWTSGQGFAPLDLASVESWLIDTPRGDHLLIALRELSMDISDIPIRQGRSVIVWSKNDLAAFVGKAVLDGTLFLSDEKLETELDDESQDQILFIGSGPFVLKAEADFTVVDEAGLDLASSRPILLEARIHRVIGTIKGPEEETVDSWVLDCEGLFKVDNVELFQRAPMLRRQKMNLAANPDFTDSLSERRAHDDGFGSLLHWWRFQNDSAKVETYNVLVPAHMGKNGYGETWIFNNLTKTLHTNI